MKQCKECNEYLSDDDFTLDSSSKDKLKSWCKECTNDYQRTYNRNVRARSDKREYFLYYDTDRRGPYNKVQVDKLIDNNNTGLIITVLKE